jgi:hypothetical protein
VANALKARAAVNAVKAAGKTVEKDAANGVSAVSAGKTSAHRAS